VFLGLWRGANPQIKGRKIKLLKHVFALYSLPIIFSKKFSLAMLARLRFMHLEMQAYNVLYQPHLYFLLFGVIISDCQLPKFTKTRIKLHKIAYEMSKNCLRGEGGGGKSGGSRENWEEERHGCWGDRRPWRYCRRISPELETSHCEDILTESIYRPYAVDTVPKLS